MNITSEQIRAARALVRLEQAGAEFILDGVRRRSAEQGDGIALYQDLRAISLRSGARLQDQKTLTDADLYDEDGLPA